MNLSNKYSFMVVKILKFIKIRVSFILFFLIIIPNIIFGQSRTIHVFVALCDNKHQGIVPVPASLGNGKDIKNNLYWGAGYGVKSYFKNKTTNWNLISKFKSNNPYVLERLLFRHTIKDVYMLADAYDGEQIKNCIEDFLRTSNGQLPIIVKYNSLELKFGGYSDLIAYIGHDGLMDFDVDISYNDKVNKTIDVITLACYSKKYFLPEIRKAKANPILWTTHLMAPEAYTLKSAIDGWILNEAGTLIKERVSRIYHKYQKCGLKGARNLFTTGF